MYLRVRFKVERETEMEQCGIWNDVSAIPISCSNTENPARRQSSQNITVILWFKLQQGCWKSGSVLVAHWRAWTAQSELSMDLLVLILHLKDSVGGGTEWFSIPAEHLWTSFWGVLHWLQLGEDHEADQAHSRGLDFPYGWKWSWEKVAGEISSLGKIR